MQALKVLFRKEKEIEIWKVRKLCLKGKIYMSCLALTQSFMLLCLQQVRHCYLQNLDSGAPM